MRLHERHAFHGRLYCAVRGKLLGDVWRKLVNFAVNLVDIKKNRTINKMPMEFGGISGDLQGNFNEIENF